MTTTRQIEIFVKVAELESVRLAAEQLDVSQPTVSKHLKALERRVGGELFERRRGQRVRLSPLGRELLADARRSLQARQRIHRSLERRAPASGPTIFVRGFMSDMIKRRFEALEEAGLPAGSNFVLVDDRDDIMGMVRKTPGSISILRSAEPGRAAGLLSSVLKAETLSLYGSPKIAEALAEGTLLPEQIHFLRYRRQAEADRWGQELLEAAGLAQARQVAAPQFIELVTEKVMRGEGISTFFDWHVRDTVEAGGLVSLSPDSTLAFLMLVGHPSLDEALFGQLVQVFQEHL